MSTPLELTTTMPEVTGKIASRQSKDTIGPLLGGGVMLTLFGWALVITQQPETRVGSFGDTVTEDRRRCSRSVCCWPSVGGALVWVALTACGVVLGLRVSKE